MEKAARVTLVKSYAWRWFLAALGLGLIFVVVVSAATMLFLGNGVSLADFSFLEAMIFFFVFSTILIAVLMTLFYRLTMGLPCMACGFGELTWRQSWNATKPVTGPIFTMCCAAAAVLSVVECLATVIGFSDTSFVRGAWETVVTIASTLIGAGMLNQLYQKVMAD